MLNIVQIITISGNSVDLTNWSVQITNPVKIVKNMRFTKTSKEWPVGLEEVQPFVQTQTGIIPFVP